MPERNQRPRIGGRTAIVAAANYWGSPITTGSHHYARLFVEAGWTVAYLSDQISPLHLLRWKSRMYTADKFRIWARGGVRALGGRLFAYNHLTLLPVFGAPLLRSEFVARWSLDVTVPNLMRKLEREGFGSPDVLMVDHLIFADLLDRVRAGATIYRMADDPRRFPEAYPAPMLARVERLLRDVDLVVATARRLYDSITQRRKEGVLYIPNGVNYDHFARPPGPPPPEYAMIPEPRVVFTGSLEGWFDDELLEEVARQRPDISFVVIGPARIPMRGLRRLRNVHILGRRSYDDLPAYLAHAQVGIIPYRVSEPTNAVNPLKLYEYLAAGLPVVATAWDELEHMQPPALLARGAADFGAALDSVLEDPGDPGVRRAYAREHSWEARFAVICDALGLDPSNVYGNPVGADRPQDA